MKDWRKIRRSNFTSLEKLSLFLNLDVHQKEQLAKIPYFPLNLPLRLAEKIKKNTLDDPLLKQFIPLKEEETHTPGFSCNPVGDTEAIKSSKCLQKYEGRVLLLPTSACAMNCRFCFRKHFPYDAAINDLSQEITLIKNDPSIKEVILSGGDPLSLPNSTLEKLIEKLSNIAHVKRLRFHTRFPIGIPERIDPELLSIFQKSSLKIWFVIHCNHARELDEDILFSLKKIQVLGIPVLGQTVLLKDVNDSVKELKNLFENLVDAGVVPYYLHQFDKVQGGAHFEVSEEKGMYLMEELKKIVSGYALPRYVKEISGKPSKTLISSP